MGRRYLALCLGVTVLLSVAYASDNAPAWYDADAEEPLSEAETDELAGVEPEDAPELAEIRAFPAPRDAFPVANGSVHAVAIDRRIALRTLDWTGASTDLQFRPWRNWHLNCIDTTCYHTVPMVSCLC